MKLQHKKTFELMINGGPVRTEELNDAINSVLYPKNTGPWLVVTNDHGVIIIDINVKVVIASTTREYYEHINYLVKCANDYHSLTLNKNTVNTSGDK
jgi:hypothetical protein